MKEKIDKILRENFKLEFLNRIDEIVAFKSLTRETLMEIVDLELAKVEKRLKDKNIKLKVAAKIKKMLSEKGYDITFGARPLKRIIQSNILDELAMEIIEGKIKDGDSVTIDLGVMDRVLVTVK
jgi:ATP-dependent Clp protease ATP-binding subunit ClpA